MVSSVRAHQEASNMSKVDLSIGCLKALVDSQKRVIEDDDRLKNSDIGVEMMKKLISAQEIAHLKYIQS